ncbi:MAG: UDP-N-acetylmuramoyl-tripeptide--D-alanyl-D-alanine ligase [Coriobacteriaceae bacterium]|nr:UDP-N-acetylmuramoyl-tripeptide--D-alanyl-D-alanine ligase [Coriobacteriaceae bacterium]
MHLSIEDIASYTNGVIVAPGRPGAMASGLTWDSREVKPGDLYVALPGDRVDGHDFCTAASDSGAACVLVMHDLDEASSEKLHAAACGIVEVADTADALVALARAWRGYLSGTVVGITGSSGKTTTKNLVRDVLSAAMDVTATKANQNNELGVPRTLLSAGEDTDAIVVEMGMRGMGQIAALCEFVRPDMGLVTNVGTSHIELLGSRENIALAKGELLDNLPVGGFAFLNADDEYSAYLLNMLELDDRGVRCIFYAGSDAFEHVDELGVFRNADPFVWASDVSYDAQGRPTFTMHARHFAEIGLPDLDGDAPCTLELRGAHNVSNACAAAAVGMALGMRIEQCCAALAAAQPERGRQQVLTSGEGVVVVDDSYNANPDSMRASLSMFQSMEVAGRRIAVLGDMGELGDYSAEGHALVGEAAAHAGVDMLVCVGQRAAGIAESARKAGFPAAQVVEVKNAHDAIPVVRDAARAGDAVLVKASHSMELNRVVEGLMA